MRSMAPPATPLSGTSLEEKIVALTAFAKKLRCEFACLRETSLLLRKESSELRADARLLRNYRGDLRAQPGPFVEPSAE